jgi:hypothetical protein
MGRSSVFQSSVANGVYGGSNLLVSSINANKIELFAPKGFPATSDVSFTKNNSSSLMKNFLLYGLTNFVNNNVDNAQAKSAKVIKY